MFDCPLLCSAIWTLWADHEELHQAPAGPRLTQTHLGQAAPYRVGHQEDEGGGRHSTFHPAGEVVLTEEKSGGLC